MEQREQVDKAVHRYLRALDAQLVAGVMCRRLMKASLWMGRRSEARGVYQRFSQTLRAKLDVPPRLKQLYLCTTTSRTSSSIQIQHFPSPPQLHHWRSSPTETPATYDRLP